MFFFIDAPITSIYTLSLHDALPISLRLCSSLCSQPIAQVVQSCSSSRAAHRAARQPRISFHSQRSPPFPDRCTMRSEEHTSELQSRQYLVCRLLLEKKNRCQHDSCG